MRVAVVTWLLLISGAVAINHVAQSGLAAQVETHAPGLQVAVLENRLAELTQQVEHTQQQPDALPQARYEAERLAMEQRLSAIETSLGNQPAADNLLPLQARLDQLEMRLSAPPPALPTPPRPRAAAPAKPKAIEPPFRVIGTELRADEQFLSILPAASDALTQVRLLRPGETEAGWHLEAIETNTAVFRYGADSRRLPIPAR
ncbi:Methyl-accepting chemotaxis protein [Pseudomonas paraeruginosa]|nr:Methyl-accepting chemotaxis protein [Pseudomonas aeruginosa]